MYEKRHVISMRLSASAVAHNLSLALRPPGNVYRTAVIHRASVNLLSWDFESGTQTTYELISQSQTNETKTVLQVAWCTIAEKLTVILLCRDGVQIYDETGTQLHFWFHFQEENTYGRCMTTFKENNLAIGDNIGNILIFRLGPKCSDAAIAHTISTEHSGAIACLSANGGVYIATGGDDGKVSIHDAAAPYSKQHTFNSYSHSVTGINIWKTWIVAAYGSGHLRLFDIKSRLILAEVTAHAKWITAMDVVESNGLVLTVSEDTFVRVWQMTPSDEGVMSHKFSQSIPDVSLCGCRFLDLEGTSFALTGFEYEEMFCYFS